MHSENIIKWEYIQVFKFFTSDPYSKELRYKKMRKKRKKKERK